jgi:hypothetical protein
MDEQIEVVEMIGGMEWDETLETLGRNRAEMELGGLEPPTSWVR